MPTNPRYFHLAAPIRALVPIDAGGTYLPKGSTIIGLVPCEIYSVLYTEMKTRESFQVGFIVPVTEATLRGS